MNSKLTSLEKECGNCIYFKPHEEPALGRIKGECGAGQGERTCTDYCYRWEVTNGHVEVTGRSSNSGSKARNVVSGTISDNRSSASIENDRQ